MSQQNPYIQDANTRLPKHKYRIRFLPMDRIIEVDPADLPYGDHGRPGSILDIALHHGIDVDHACGGVCACSTCHVIVREGLKSCNEPDDEEEDQLDDAYGLTPQSRLACQCVPDGSADIVVEIPSWNRNLVRE
ncbi:MAG TPA: 2Fe-2S iron-sulfur cluster-binding protein [Phycisphaerae bacterium]|jgi:2Fe-2S ferredoxin|nr:2Fe-2S iron-sulfur cluster binding domain-containing protein [Phycisphaerae bacterium]HOB75522.1 2Fe-2S iron-sulfur cluster-binding protein [Phycisphaerae bacterium]HOJ55887.1 2Fe-2S iron-sulfur cluster-binding protein [Phycisphaerae bacterium]HOL27151.1 2Fe-2S iron-sulfur cluster-binding protein [Phycisphaerae bacterium]HPP21558.1 2Fe-2S iron-sulfur cluster-binding protein [Phycisphaerae bacterium]